MKLHCRRCYTEAFTDVEAPVSLLSSIRKLSRFWTVRGRAVFVCVAEVCARYVPDGHVLMIENWKVSLVWGPLTPIQAIYAAISGSGHRPAVHAALLPAVKRHR